MFQNLDTVIAFTVVMLLLSLIITTWVQLVISLGGIRGWQLVWGLRMLFQEAGKDNAEAVALARKVLTHPALAPTRNWLVYPWRWARQILVKLSELTGVGKERFGKAEARLAKLEPLGWRPPTAITLEDIQLALESLDEELDANGEGKLEKWYETVMDATTERFKLRSRWITAAGAILLAFGLQVDSGEIFSQLHQNSEVRAQLLAQAKDVQDAYTKLEETDKIEDHEEKADELKKTRDDLNEIVAKSELRIFKDWSEKEKERLEEPKDQITEAGNEVEKAKEELEKATPGAQAAAEAALREAKDRLRQEQIELYRTRFVLAWDRVKAPTPGMIVTALLLSLGAPFWYGILSNLLNFRSIAAKPKEDE